MRRAWLPSMCSGKCELLKLSGTAGALLRQPGKAKFQD